MAPPLTRLRAIAALVAGALGMEGAGAQTLGEVEHKVAIIYNIMLFVQWPAADAGEPLRLCVADTDALGSGLLALDGRAIHSRLIEVRSDPDLRLAACHAVYLAPRSVEILKQLGVQPVLTIGNGHGLVDQGVMVNLVQEGRHIGFDIGVGALRRARLAVSAKLLRLARYVKDD